MGQGIRGLQLSLCLLGKAVNWILREDGVKFERFDTIFVHEGYETVLQIQLLVTSSGESDF